MALDETTIARPYAQAAFQIASESGKLTEWSDQLAFLGAVVSDPEMSALIGNPNFSRDDLEKLLTDICQEKFNPEGMNLLRILIANKRLKAASAMSEEFEQLKRDAEGTVDVVVTSAYVIKSTEENELVDLLEKKLGKKVNLSTEKDASLIGGVRIRAGDLVIDGSIQGRLRQLATEFGI